MVVSRMQQQTRRPTGQAQSVKTEQSQVLDTNAR